MSSRQRLTKYRTAVQAVFDCSCWLVGVVFATLLRYDLRFSAIRVIGLVEVAPLVVALQLLFGFGFGLYRWRWRLGSFDEVLALTGCVSCSTGVLFIANLVSSDLLVPRSVPLGAGIAALASMCGGRYMWRLSDEHRRRPRAVSCQRLIVYGAGEAGAQIVRALLINPDSQYLPVALIDDDLGKRNLRIMGVPVVGDRSKILQVAERFDADAILAAVPAANTSLIAELSEIAASCALTLKVLPPVWELLDGRVGVADIRDVDPADLLGRHEIHTDLEAIAGYLRGKRVLVTGAGGSIGSELCRQISGFAPAELIMLDRDESALHTVELSIHGRALLESPNLVLVDLRDRAAMEAVLAVRRPQVIFHAAALKHLPLLERHPAEAVKTNVWGTLDLLELAVEYGVERVVNISTDKAADPSSVLGFSKRITERLSAHMDRHGPTVCLSVRFGNVLGSRGSVLPTFNAQIDQGGPLTVTDPDVTRFFMTIEEAVQLVIQAGAIGRGGEVLVLDMGEAVRIAEVAQLLAARSDRRIAIQYTGLRTGEKLHEVLLSADEVDQRPVHPLISHVRAPALEPSVARELDVSRPAEDLVKQLDAACHRPATTLITVPHSRPPLEP